MKKYVKPEMDIITLRVNNKICNNVVTVSDTLAFGDDDADEVLDWNFGKVTR